MQTTDRTYMAIDLKSFYASVECVERGLDPLTTNLVVADVSRTEKTICLAVSPSLKAHGIPGRARLFEVIARLREVNGLRLVRAGSFEGKSVYADELSANPKLEIDYIAAVPRMALYIDYSTRIYNIYRHYVAPEDIHVYSIDEVFMDVTGYLSTYKMTADALARKIIMEIFTTTGITATAGIGTNMYLCKVAMDIMAKHTEPDENGVRVAYLNEQLYREQLWSHTPLTDFWRIGRGYSTKLAAVGLHTMGDVAKCSLGKTGDYYNEDLLFKMFGVNAELLIDHAWGYEPCTIADIKAYKPEAKSLSQGQVLQSPYGYKQAEIVVREMAEALALDLVAKGLMTQQTVLYIGYDIENVKKNFSGEIKQDRYGREMPKHANGTFTLKKYTASSELLIEAFLDIFKRTVDPALTIRRINLAAVNVLPEQQAAEQNRYEQLDLFSLFPEEQQLKEEERLKKERSVQKAMLDIKSKFGKNAIIRGTDLQEGATAIQRNSQIGGHKA